MGPGLGGALGEAAKSVANEDHGVGKQELLAGGIAMALITTASGLCVAIPALALYHWFGGRVQNLVQQLDEVANGLVDSLFAEPGGPKAPPPSPPMAGAVLPHAVSAGAQA